MVFSSVTFLFYFLPLFLLLYILLPGLRTWTIIVGSIVFYAWGEPVYVLLLFWFILMNWALGKMLQTSNQRTAGIILFTGVAANLSLLVFFKYATFFIEQADALLAVFGMPSLPVPVIPLPLGISFFAFQGISYLVDIRRGDVVAQNSLTKFAMYKAMFPQLIAGPILRYSQIAHEINDRRIHASRMRQGVELFIIGLAQKVLIANTVALPADQIFALPADQLTMATAWLGSICYMLQILFDFSGYTTMAIGLGHMIGFSLPPNFNRPYTAQSITDFWRRWHMSLSTWFRDYLYIPLGGNRAGPLRTYANLLLVFVLCGLWHGAAWTFALWGLYHGLFLIMERAAGKAWPGWQAPRPIRHAYTLLVVLVGWVIFRAETIGQARQFLSTMLGFGRAGAMAAPVEQYATNSVLLAIAAAILVIVWNPDTGSRVLRWRLTSGLALHATRFAASLALFIVTAAALASGTHNPFIYFRF